LRVESVNLIDRIASGPLLTREFHHIIQSTFQRWLFSQPVIVMLQWSSPINHRS